MPRFIAILSSVLLLLLVPAVVLAQQSNSSRIDLTINQGPGLLLPTSPFYFADIVKNNFRLFLASDNSKKAKTHLDIAGERIAEIKVMFEQNDMPQQALNTALASMVENVDGAKNALKSEKNSGKNVEKLASDLNTIINAQKDSLRILEAKTDIESGLKIKAELAKVREIEVKVEDEMAADLRKNETNRELADALGEATQDASIAAEKAISLRQELDKDLAVKPTGATKSGSKASVAGAATESSSKKETAKNPQQVKVEPQ